MKAVALCLDVLTFHQVYSAYESLLAANPGKALVVPCGDAVFMLGREVCTASLIDGCPDLANASCVDPRAWSEAERCWQCDDDTAMTATAILQPRFVVMPPATDEHWLTLFHGGRWWSFGPDEVARWDDEERCFHFHAYHRMQCPSVEAIADFLRATGGA